MNRSASLRAESSANGQGLARLLRILALATFIVFFQAYMVAPLIPTLASGFGVSPLMMGAIVPAYLIPYGRATLVVGLLADRLGRSRLMLGSVILFVVLVPLSATYAYVLLNAMFHSGVFTWLGLHFGERYALGDVGIGLALLGYGVPGMLFGPAIGRLAVRHGRRLLIPGGLTIAAVSALLLVPAAPVIAAATAVMELSLG